MRIILTVNATWNIWNFRRPLVEALIADGHDVTVLAPPDDTVSKLSEIGAECIPIEMDVKGVGLLSNLGLVAEFRRQFRTLKPDIVLSYTIKNNIFGAIAARMTGTPFLPNVTGLGTIFLGSRAMALAGGALYRFGMGHLPIVFVQNDDDRQFLISGGMLRESRIRMLPGSGIDLQSYAARPMPENDGTLRFLMISRLIRDKGTMEYLEAARIVRAQNPHCQFELVGPMGAENRTAISFEDLQPYLDDGTVEYTGPTSDVRPFIETAHCIVLPSYREGAPRTLIEAAAMGRPLIATDVPGCRAVVEDGRNGFLCIVRDARSLAETFSRFASLTPNDHERFANRSREIAEQKFDVTVVIERYRKAIADLTA